MRDTAGARLLIGGTLPARLVSPLCSLIRTHTVTRDHDGAAYTPHTREDLCTGLDPDGYLVLRRVDAPDGEFLELETWLRKQRIGYSRWNDATEEFSASVSHFRAGWRRPRHFYTDGLEQVYHPETLLRRLRSLLLAGRTSQALRLLNTTSTDRIAPLPPFRIASRR